MVVTINENETFIANMALILKGEKYVMFDYIFRSMIVFGSMFNMFDLRILIFHMLNLNLVFRKLPKWDNHNHANKRIRENFSEFRLCSCSRNYLF